MSDALENALAELKSAVAQALEANAYEAKQNGSLKSPVIGQAGTRPEEVLMSSGISEDLADHKNMPSVPHPCEGSSAYKGSPRQDSDAKRQGLNSGPKQNPTLDARSLLEDPATKIFETTDEEIRGFQGKGQFVGALIKSLKRTASKIMLWR